MLTQQVQCLIKPAFSCTSLNLIKKFSIGEKQFGTDNKLLLESPPSRCRERNYHGMRTHSLGEKMSFNGGGDARFVCILMSVLPPTGAFYSKVSKPEAGAVFA